MITAKEVCRQEAVMLVKFMHTISPRSRRFFITRVMERAGLPRRNWYNWQYAHSRIPDHAKRVIEREAGCRVFDAPPTLPLCVGSRCTIHN